jgi:hypothetical protein
MGAVGHRFAVVVFLQDEVGVGVKGAREA